MSDGAPRLSRATLAGAPRSPRVTGPLLDPASLTIGIVHFGVGSFHRSHQAIFTEDAASATDRTDWGILAVTGRSDSMVHRLRPQDNLYGVLIADDDRTSLRLVGSIVDVVSPDVDSERVVATIAAQTTRLATLTITEVGYRRVPTGGIDRADPDIAHDVRLLARELAAGAGAAPSRTPIGLLVRGLARRFVDGGEGFAVVSCDNLLENGDITRELVHAFAAAVDTAVHGVSSASSDHAAAFRDWLARAVTFPSTMVDRITPTTTAADRRAAFELLGLRDEALVVAEPFVQWVIEDDFTGERPAWELAGAILTDDVSPYERVKLRVLNATHSLLAWLGSLCGYATIADAVGDERLRRLALMVLDDDVLPTLSAPDGLDLAAYRDEVLHRMANPALAHATAQVAADGSVKLPIRVLGTAVDRLAAGVVPRGLALVVAAWIAYIDASLIRGAAPLQDPIADRLIAAVGPLGSLDVDPGRTVDHVLALDAVFPAALRRHTGFRDAVVEQIATVRELAAASTPVLESTQAGIDSARRRVP